MQNQYKTLDYFKSSLLDVSFALPEILDDPSHPEYANLKADVEIIDLIDLELYVEENKTDGFLDRQEDKHLGRCSFYLINKIQAEIAKERLEIISDIDHRPAPYNSTNLSDLILQENNLVFTKELSQYRGGFKYKNYVYNLTPVTDASNSSYWLSEAIMRLSYGNGLNFKIRLDPFIEVNSSEYNPMSYKMDIYGRKLDWDRLKNLREDEHGRWMDEKSYSQIGMTDYVWRPEENEIHFTMEELPKMQKLEVRGSRYFHAIFDKDSGLIKHCDGAVRIYTKEEYKNRISFHVRNPEVRKVGKRVKLFQIDENIDKITFGLLATTFMVWNHDVLEYFN